MIIQDLAKKYNVSNDELIKLLRKAGYDVADHKSPVDYDMLAALGRHFSWSSTTAKKKAKAKSKAKAKAKAVAEDEAIESKAKAKIKAKTKLVRKDKPAAPAASADDDAATRTKTKVKVKAKSKAKAKTETKVKAETKAKTKTKAKVKARTKVEAEPAVETAAPVAEPESKPVAKPAPKPEPPPEPEPTTPKARAQRNMDPETARRMEKLGSAVIAPPPIPKPEPKPKPRPEPPKKHRQRVAEPDRDPMPGPVPPTPGRPAKKGKRGKPGRMRKSPEEQEAQQKAVRESVRRTLAKLETTRKTKRKKTRDSEDEEVDLKPVQVQELSTVAMLASALGVSTAEILETCEELGVEATVTTELERDQLEMIAESLGRVVEVEATYGETRLREAAQIDPAKLVPRAPVVTIMGHVDHGKTSILDYIRKTRVADGEAGGITQHIGAYQVDTPNGTIAFVDTPGHEAFTSMRARGAQLTDIVVLVVAADDGVMPQTIEAINHTRAAGVAMVVAVNKIDIPGVNPAAVKQQLMQYEVMLEEYGGDVVGVEVSAKTGEGIDKLLEMILLQAELQELKADPTSPAQGVVVEVKKEEGRGIMVTVLVQQGTLKVGDVLVLGNEYAKVRSLVDYAGKPVKQAGPSTPVQVLGANGLPEAGDPFIAVKNEREAREISEMRLAAQRARELTPAKSLTLEDLYAQIQGGAVKELYIIVKADTDGSVEAVKQSLERLQVLETRVKVIHAAVGVVSESDVLLASSSSAVIIAFNTKVSPQAKSLAQQKGTEIRAYNIIYEAIEDVTDALKGMLEPEYTERILGRAEVRQLFRVSRLGTIAGTMVVEGSIPRSASVRVKRDDEVLFEGKLGSLKRFQEDVKEVQENFECGIGVSGFNDFVEGDIIEAFVVEEKVRVF